MLLADSQLLFKRVSFHFQRTQPFERKMDAPHLALPLGREETAV